jgi:hypothetical protein
MGNNVQVWQQVVLVQVMVDRPEICLKLWLIDPTMGRVQLSQSMDFLVQYSCQHMPFSQLMLDFTRNVSCVFACIASVVVHMCHRDLLLPIRSQTRFELPLRLRTIADQSISIEVF